MSTYPNPDLTTAGQRRAVWEGRALKTRGGLNKGDLMVSNSTGKIVSKRASRASKRSYERNGLQPNRNIAEFRGTHHHMDWEEALLRD